MSLRVFCSLARAFNVTPKNVRFMSFKSEHSLDNLYPNSVNIKPFTPPKSKDGKFTGYIPIKELKISSMAASAPGGQNVNKTETKVDIRFHVKSATWLSDETKEKIIKKHYTRINKDGYFIVRSEKTRSKVLNTADAMKYLRELIYKLEEPEPQPDFDALEKHRKAKEKAARERLMQKRRRSLMLAEKVH